MRPTLKDWSARVRQRTDDLVGVDLITPAPEAATSWGGPFRAVASDNREYFVKTLAACPPGRGSSLAVELIVARAGKLIGAPVCETSLVYIPDAFDGWALRHDLCLKSGWAHGSLAIDRADDIRPELSARGRDNNKSRHVGIYALYNWCFGKDPQWLHDLNADRQIYSHDHGLYLPSDGTRAWTRDLLVYEADTPHPLPDPTDGLSLEAIDAYAKALEAVTREDLASILNTVPRSWPVSDTDLEDLGWFLEYRAPLVAEWMRSLI